MESIENALRIIQFDFPQWIPASMPIYNVGFHGSRDYAYVHGESPPPHPAGETRTNIWGVGKHKVRDEVGGYHTIPSLPSPSALAAFEWPDPNDERICASIYQQATDFPGGDLWISGGHGPLIWEIANPLVGMERLLEYFYTEPGFVKEVFEQIIDFHLGIAHHYIKIGVKSVGFSDDLAMQSGPFFSSDVLEEFFKPGYQRIFDFYKQHGVLIGQHCDGNVDKLLDFFMDVGLDILNPVQVLANDLAEVRRRTQGRLCLHGGISNVIVSEGPPEKIEQHVRESLWTLGRDHGYFPAVDHHMPTPEANRRAVVDAIEKWGHYPLVSPWDA